MWEPSGLDVLASHDLLIADGNGADSPGQQFDHSNAVIELSASLRAVGDFAPSNWAQLTDTDGDLDSTGPAVLPGSMAFIVGKAGTGFLLNTAPLGGVGSQVASSQVCDGTGTFGADAVAGETVYILCTNGLTAVVVSGRAWTCCGTLQAATRALPWSRAPRWGKNPGRHPMRPEPCHRECNSRAEFPFACHPFPWLVAVESNLYAPDGTSVVALGHL
jgi:hypothetical protein